MKQISHYQNSVITLLTIIICLFISMTTFAKSQDIYPFSSQKKQAQFNYLSQELRCLVCQNQNLMDSNADLAKDLRLQVYEMVTRGQTNQQIITYLTNRYGDFILFKPPFKRSTILLWLGPLIILICGIAVLLYQLSRQRRRAVE